MLSRRSRAYQELIGGRDLPDGELLDLLIREPRLLRRPPAIRGGRATIGFDREGLAALARDADDRSPVVRPAPEA